MAKETIIICDALPPGSSCIRSPKYKGFCGTCPTAKRFLIQKAQEYGGGGPATFEISEDKKLIGLNSRGHFFILYNGNYRPGQ